MAGPPPFPLLFSPLRLRGRELRNRVVRLPTNSVMAERNRPTDAMVAHYARMAAGGAGMVVTEAFAVHPASTRGPRLVAMFDPDVVPALARMATAVCGSINSPVSWSTSAIVAEVSTSSTASPRKRSSTGSIGPEAERADSAIAICSIASD